MAHRHVKSDKKKSGLDKATRPGFHDHPGLKEAKNGDRHTHVEKKSGKRTGPPVE